MGLQSQTRFLHGPCIRTLQALRTGKIGNKQKVTSNTVEFWHAYLKIPAVLANNKIMTLHPIPDDLAWKSFSHQLQPGMMWGVATIVTSPLKLLEQIKRVYFRCLPMITVNCHINLLWQLISEKYKGLGMANCTLVSLSSKLSFIQRSCGFNNVNLRALMMGYKSFMVKVGLYGNTMDYDYKAYSILARNNKWFKNVYEIVHYFNILLVFHSEYHLQPARQGDRSLMSEFSHIGYRQMELGLLNIIRMHKMVTHLLDILMCGGKTIKTEMFSGSVGQSDMHKFLLRKPTEADLTVWVAALCRISSKFHVLMVPLREYINSRHTQWHLGD